MMTELGCSIVNPTESEGDFDEFDHVPLVSRRKLLLASKRTSMFRVDIAVKKEEEDDQYHLQNHANPCVPQGEPSPGFYKTIWKADASSKVKFLCWLIVLEKVNTFDMVQRRHLFLYISPSWCIMCKKSDELANHLFLHCEMASWLWKKIMWEFDISWGCPSVWWSLLMFYQKNCLLSLMGKKVQFYRDALFKLLCGSFGQKGTREFLSVEVKKQLGFGPLTPRLLKSFWFLYYNIIGLHL